MRSVLLLSLMFYPTFSAKANANDVAAMDGVWRTVRHGALVQISDCGNASPCGKLAWIDDAISQGHTKDVRNRNAALRDRALIGAPILWGFQRDEHGWHNGWLYNPDDGKSFRAKLNLLSQNELRVTGCLGPLCRSQVWTRVKNN